MRERIKIREIRRALEENQNLTTKPLTEGGYTVQEKGWTAYDSSLGDFGITFFISLPDNVIKKDLFISTSEIFRKYIEETLSKGEKHDLSAVEFGGPGSNLFGGFANNFFKQTVGVCLTDIRNQIRKKIDNENNHSVVTGDILDMQSDHLLTKVVETLGTNKTDLIISRMIAPLNFINKNPAILDRIVRNWYAMLSENGLMFIQFGFNGAPATPSEKLSTSHIVRVWSEAIKERFSEIDIQVKMGVMRLHKKAGAPEKLPPATQLFK